MFQQYKELFDNSGSNPGDKTLEDKFFEYEVRRFLIIPWNLILTNVKSFRQVKKKIPYLTKKETMITFFMVLIYVS